MSLAKSRYVRLLNHSRPVYNCTSYLGHASQSDLVLQSTEGILDRHRFLLRARMSGTSPKTGHQYWLNSSVGSRGTSRGDHLLLGDNVLFDGILNRAR